MGKIAAINNHPEYQGATSVADYQTSEGFSEASDQLNNIIETFKSISDPQTVNHNKDRLNQDLSALYYNSSSANWDGYDAVAISLSSYVNAKVFLDTFSNRFPLPTLTPDPDGEICFDWEFDDKDLSVSVGESNVLSYAAYLDENNKMDGVLVADGRHFPKVLEFALNQIFGI